MNSKNSLHTSKWNSTTKKLILCHTMYIIRKNRSFFTIKDGSNSCRYFFLCTVKLCIKELLNREQTGFKELFTVYQPFYTIDLLLNRELWQSRKYQNLALVNTKLWKLVKKRGLTNFFWPIFGFYTKKSPQNWRFTHFMKTFWNQIYDWLQNRNCFFLILHWVSFPTKKD